MTVSSSDNIEQFSTLVIGVLQGEGGGKEGLKK